MSTKIFNSSIPKCGYILATRYDRFNLFSEAIYRRQLIDYIEEDARFTHVAILSGQYRCVNIMPPKAKLIDISKVYRGHYIKILKYNGEDYDNHLRYLIGCLYNALSANLRFDWLGAAGFIFPGLPNLRKRYFCSEAVAQAYQIFYPNAFNYAPPEKVMPAMIVSNSDFTIHYEGYI